MPRHVIRPAPLLALLGTLSACGGDSGPTSDSVATAAPTLDSAYYFDPTRVPASATPSLDNSKRFALLVSIGTYPSRLHNLPGPPFDAAGFQDVLVSRLGIPRENIVHLADGQANRRAIIETFRSHLSKAGENGMALFYFVGHGVTLDSNYSVQDPEITGKDQAYFVWGEQGNGSIVLDDELHALVNESGAGRTVVIIDACHSGTSNRDGIGLFKYGLRTLGISSDSGDAIPMMVAMNKQRSPFVIPSSFISDGKQIAALDQLPLVLMTGADEAETAWSVRNWSGSNISRSVFSFHFESALRAADPNETFASLMLNVGRQVRGWSECVKHRVFCQTPQLRGGLKTAPLSSVLGTR